MEIKVTVTNRKGEIENITYRDIVSEADFAGVKISGCRAYSFYQDKFVIVYVGTKGYWTPPGGGVEESESVAEAIFREVKEETNMRVIKNRFMGLVEVIRPKKTSYYTSSVCLVEPEGDFVADPDGDITEIKLIDFKDSKKYSDPRIPAIVDREIERILELKKEMENEI